MIMVKQAENFERGKKKFYRFDKFVISNMKYKKKQSKL